MTQVCIDSVAVGTEVASVEMDAPEPGEDVPREARHEQQVHADISTEKPEANRDIKPVGSELVRNITKALEQKMFSLNPSSHHGQ